MRRKLIRGTLLGGLAAALLLLASLAGPDVRSQTQPDPTKALSTEQKLDSILKRLGQIEKRLEALEKVQSPDARARTVTKTATAPATWKLDRSTGLPRMADKPKPQATTFQGCPPAGKGKDRETNIRKNRVDSSETWVSVPFDAVHDLEIPDEVGKYRYNWTDDEKEEIAENEGVPLAVEGYIVKVKPNRSPESCNCGETTKDMIDYHLPLTKSKNGAEKDSIIVEVTPRIRAQHAHWDEATIERLAENQDRVRISGWLFFDSYHRNHLGKFRATLWEIHPIMEIEVQKGDQWLKLDDWAGMN